MKQKIAHNARHFNLHNRGVVYLVTTLCGLLFALSVILLMLQYNLSVKPRQIIFHSSGAAGRMIPQENLSEPDLSLNELNNWVVQSVIDTFSFNFTDYWIHINQIKEYYSKDGYNDIKKELQPIVEKIRKDKLVISSRPIDAPKIIDSGVRANGLYEWEIDLPIILRYTSSKSDFNKSVDLKMTVRRVNLSESIRGVKIVRLQANTKY